MFSRDRTHAKTLVVRALVHVLRCVIVELILRLQNRRYSHCCIVSRQFCMGAYPSCQSTSAASVAKLATPPYRETSPCPAEVNTLFVSTVRLFTVKPRPGNVSRVPRYRPPYRSANHCNGISYGEYPSTDNTRSVSYESSPFSPFSSDSYSSSSSDDESRGFDWSLVEPPTPPPPPLVKLALSSRFLRHPPVPPTLLEPRLLACRSRVPRVRVGPRLLRYRRPRFNAVR